jgi:LPXTG-motif cell wall-anchored protein
MASDDNVQEPAPGGGGTGSYWVAVAGLVLLVGIVGFALVRRQDSRPPRPEIAPAIAEEEESDQPAPTLIKAEVPAGLSPEARIMTERYYCVCGCGDRLSVCNCRNTPGSVDMKAYVEELVSARKSIREMDQAMVERYGEQVLIGGTEESAADGR